MISIQHKRQSSFKPSELSKVQTSEVCHSKFICGGVSENKGTVGPWWKRIFKRNDLKFTETEKEWFSREEVVGGYFLELGSRDCSTEAECRSFGGTRLPSSCIQNIGTILP